MTSSSPSLEIRRLTELEELNQVEELQRDVWSFEEVDIVPARLMRVSSKSGCLVLGAYDEAGRMVGFAYGFPGIRDDRELIYCSHMLAVRPEVRNRNVGRDLKLAQREWILTQPIDLVTWTYDPLEVKNGYLNLTKLGAVTNQYIENLYGVTSSPLHGGLDTDRFFIHWNIRTSRVEQRIDPSFDAGAFSRNRLEELGLDAVINRTRVGDEKTGTRFFESVDLDRDEEEMLVEVPWDATPLRFEFVEQGKVWQREIRRMFQGLFARGYTLTEVLKSGEKRCFYLLVQEES